ncbi:MAG: ASPIC/UnbV domain-containing protein, partial [Gammaproteobacteria bacterium]|nr:ASPIC/UnbV domain-containing protein [Gammaproteobacteria bacterium]
QHWIRFRLLDKHGKDSIGSQILGLSGSRQYLGMVQTAGSYLALNEPVIHMGLGKAAELTNVEVKWTTGHSELFGDFATNQLHVIREGSGTSVQ